MKIPANILHSLSLSIIVDRRKSGKRFRNRFTKRNYLSFFHPHDLKNLKDIELKHRFEGNTIEILSASSSLSNRKIR